MGEMIGCVGGCGASAKYCLAGITENTSLGQLDSMRFERASGAIVGRAKFLTEPFEEGSVVRTEYAICAVDGHIWETEPESLRHFLTPSDLCERILRCGPACLTAVGGEFVVAFWDERAAQLILVRDPVGVRRLFWARLPGAGIVLSTSATWVSNHPNISKAPNFESVALTLSGLPVDQEATHFKDVHTLAPGHYLLYKNGSVQTYPYFQLPRGDDDRPFDEIAGDYRQRFLTAVSTQLTRSRKTGVSYSGGLDSSSILCVAARELDESRGLAAVSALIEGDEGSKESDFIDCGIEHTGAQRLRVAPSAYGVDWRRIVTTADRPETINWVTLLATVLNEAKNWGAGRVLFGALGDLVAGADLAGLPTLLAQHQWRAFIRECVNPRRRWMRMAPRGAVRSLASCTILGRTIMVRNVERQFATCGVGVPPWIKSTVTREFSLHERWRHIWSLRFVPVQEFSARFGEHMKLFGMGELNTMAHCSRLTGMNVGVPFADRHIVALSAQLPALARRRNGVTRHVHREAMKGIVPEIIRTRSSKAHFNGYFASIWGVWARQVGPVSSLLADWVDFDEVSRDLTAGSAGQWGHRMADLAATGHWLKNHAT